MNDIKSRGDFAKIRKEERLKALNQGKILGEKNIILAMLKKLSLTEVSNILDKDISEIQKIIE